MFFRTKLSERKLKQLHTELKVHDKEQMALKKLKTEGSDKEGIREAEIRKQFNGIMYSYGLVQASQIKEDHAKLPTNVRFPFTIFCPVMSNYLRFTDEQFSFIFQVVMKSDILIFSPLS